MHWLIHFFFYRDQGEAILQGWPKLLKLLVNLMSSSVAIWIGKIWSLNEEFSCVKFCKKKKTFHENFAQRKKKIVFREQIKNKNSLARTHRVRDIKKINKLNNLCETWPWMAEEDSFGQQIARKQSRGSNSRNSRAFL